MAALVAMQSSASHSSTVSTLLLRTTEFVFYHLLLSFVDRVSRFSRLVERHRATH